MATANQEAIQAEALDRAVNGQSLSNYPAIFEGMMAKGIPEDQIKPRENVFTFHAWKRLGRVVCKGEHGVRVTTWITYDDKRDGETKRRPKSSTVFHISQTKPLNGEEEPKPESGPVHFPGENADDIVIPADPVAEAARRAARDALEDHAREFEPEETPAPLAISYGSTQIASVEGPPEPEPEMMTLQTPGGGSLTFECETVTLEPEPCPHTQRKILPGMPCVACGATVHES